jgi:hypothetical protein
MAFNVSSLPYLPLHWLLVEAVVAEMTAPTVMARAIRIY